MIKRILLQNPAGKTQSVMPDVFRNPASFLIAILLVLLQIAPARADGTQKVGSMAVSAAYVQKLMARSHKLQLVDVRSSEEFEAIHIPGSINVALHFVKTKAYLKSKAIVLVNAGFARRELLEACGHLKKQGFRPRVLDGGLLAWHRAGGALTGDLNRLQACTRITPAMLHREKGKDKILAMDVSEKPDPNAKNFFQNVIHIPYGSPESKGPAFMKSMHRKLKKESQKRTVVFNRSGENYPAIRQALGRPGENIVFYLEGGMAAYKRHAENYALLYKSREERTKSTLCNNCGPVAKD